ncbi:MAG: OB-fold nucleic acid binding domain-containing protein, partial [Bacteroidota bacterium]|nr:OB-fold nucleic acid binding domain-containing protein [Bacteroidota bacterium]
RMKSERSNAQQSLFGGAAEVMVQKPVLPNIPEWPKLVMLEKEKALIGIYLSAHPLDDYKFELTHFTTPDVTLQNLSPEEINNLKGREVIVGGMVTEAREAMTKTGKPFSVMTLSDYKGSCQFYFFGQDYVKFSNYCKQGLFLLVKGKTLPRYGNSDQLELKVDLIELLSEVRSSRVKNVTLELPLHRITKEFIQDLDAQAMANKGNANLRFNIWDAENKIMINLFSRNTRIELTNDLLHFLQKQEDLVLKVN